jgi:hypothetical protein
MRYQSGDIGGETITVVGKMRADRVVKIIAEQLDADGTAATGTIQTVAKANLIEGERVTIPDIVFGTINYWFDVSGTYIPGGGYNANNVEVDVSGDTTAQDVAVTLAAAINGSSGVVDAGTPTAGLFTVTHQARSAVGNGGTITHTVADGGFSVSGFGSGADAGLTNIPLDDDSCSEVDGSPGEYIWRTTDMTSFPNGFNQIRFRMFDVLTGRDHLAKAVLGGFTDAAALGRYQGAIWINTNSGTAGTQIGVNGTPDNPVDTLADALTLATATGFRSFQIIDGSITLISSFTQWSFEGTNSAEAATVNLNGQDVTGSRFTQLTCSGAMTGTGASFEQSQLNGVTGFDGVATNCYLVSGFGFRNNGDAVLNLVGAITVGIVIDFNGANSVMWQDNAGGLIYIINVNVAGKFHGIIWKGGIVDYTHASNTAGTVIQGGDAVTAGPSAGMVLQDNSNRVVIEQYLGNQHGSGDWDLAQSDILSDATPFAGADIADILADTDAIDTRLPTDPADESLQQASHTQTQSDIAALNDLAIADVQTALTNQGYTAARAPNLDNLDATVSSRSDFDETTDPVELLDSGGTAGTSAAELVTDIEADLAANHGAGQWDGTDSDWTAGEREQIRYRLAIDGTQTDPTTGVGTLEDILADTDAIDTRLPSDPADESLQQAAHTQTQSDIAALNNLSIAGVQTAMTNQGYTAARAPNLDNLDATVSSRSDFDETTDPVELLDSGGTAGTSAAELVTDIEADLAANHGAGQWDGTDSDWTSAERDQIRFRLALDGSQTDPTTGTGTLEDILADTDAVDARLPGSPAAVGSAMALVADSVNASALAADAVTEIKNGVWQALEADHVTNATMGAILTRIAKPALSQQL